MSTHQGLTRRVVLASGVCVVLVGCDPRTGGEAWTGESSNSQSNLPAWAEGIGLFLTMATIGGPLVGALAGVLRLPRLAAFMRRFGVFADYASLVPDAIQFLTQERAQRFALPSLDSSPRPFIVPESENINNFESIPVFRNAVTLQFGVLNEEGGNFGDYQIYATVKRVDEPPPRTLSDVFGSADLPHAIVTPPPNGNYDGRLDIGALPPGAFVAYSWRVPRGQQPTDDYIASTGFIGPPFLSIGDADYSIDLSEIEAGKNVEARFQLPDANLG